MCHETNRAYCATIGDRSQPVWDDAPNWQKQSAITGVKFHVDHLDKGLEPSPMASHNSWLEEKRKDGWTYGPVKDAAKKTHPCFLPYDGLPMDQRLKDYLFVGVVKAFWTAAQEEEKKP